MLPAFTATAVPPAPPVLVLLPPPPLPVESIRDKTVRAGSSSTCCASSSVKLSVSDIEFLRGGCELLGRTQGHPIHGTAHNVRLLSGPRSGGDACIDSSRRRTKRNLYTAETLERSNNYAL